MGARQKLDWCAPPSVAKAGSIYRRVHLLLSISRPVAVAQPKIRSMTQGAMYLETALDVHLQKQACDI
jgi:hypothetical protein